MDPTLISVIKILIIGLALTKKNTNEINPELGQVYKNNITNTKIPNQQY